MQNELTREKIKKEIQEFIEKNGKPVNAYYYDGCELAFDYEDKQTGLCELSNKYFDYWGGDDVGYDWEELLEELGINCSVLPIEYREESEGIDSIKDFLFEYCIGNKELVDKFYKMTNEELKAWYDEIQSQY